MGVKFRESTYVHRSTSHNLHDVSKPAVPTILPEGWNATRERRPTCPESSPRGLPPSIDHSLAVESHEAETRLRALDDCEVHACIAKAKRSESKQRQMLDFFY